MSMPTEPISTNASLASEEPVFNRETIQRWFAKIGELAKQNDQQFEISVFGGSALALCFDWRESTHDVDYMPIRGAEQELNALANQAANLLGLPRDGLRSDVSIFAADHPDLIPQGDYPPGGEGGLRVFVASPEYVLAMKVLAMRSSLETQDCRDVWHLLDACGMTTTAEVARLVQDFYPGNQMPVRNLRILEDILEAKVAGQTYRQDIGW